MTLDELKDYIPLKSEIADLEYRRKKSYSVSDTVQGSYTESPYTMHPIGIQGMEDNPYTQDIARLRQSVRDIEGYISSVPDSLVRQALRLKCMDGLEWKQVAQRIGGGNTADSIRMTVNRYFLKQ